MQHETKRTAIKEENKELPPANIGFSLKHQQKYYKLHAKGKPHRLSMSAFKASVDASCVFLQTLRERELSMRQKEFFIISRSISASYLGTYIP